MHKKKIQQLEEFTESLKLHGVELGEDTAEQLFVDVAGIFESNEPDGFGRPIEEKKSPCQGPESELKTSCCGAQIVPVAGINVRGLQCAACDRRLHI